MHPQSLDVRRATRSIFVSLVLVSSGVGCAARATLPIAPKPSDDEASRRLYYERYAPLPRTREDVRLARHPFRRPPTAVQTSVVLRGGARVTHAEDLLPAVDDDSATAVAVQSSLEARESAQLWGLAAFGLGTAGTIATAATLAAAFDMQHSPPSGWLYHWLAVSGSVAGVFAVSVAATGVASTMANLYHADAQDAASHAFRAYDESLRRRLGLDDVARE